MILILIELRGVGVAVWSGCKVTSDSLRYNVGYGWTGNKGKEDGLPANGIYLCTVLCVLLMLNDKE
jgi:hypothetical protein